VLGALVRGARQLSDNNMHNMSTRRLTQAAVTSSMRQRAQSALNCRHTLARRAYNPHQTQRSAHSHAN
jgi:hypothetical protein